MTSRIGSLLVAIVLVALTAVTVFVILTLTKDNADNGGSVLLVSALRDGDVVLAREAREIKVVARDTEPVTGISLFADGSLVTQAVPVQDPVQGIFRATLTWIPDQLGVVTLTVSAINQSGRTASIDLRVEVTADASRVAAALQVTVLSPVPLQQVPVDIAVPFLIRVRTTEEVTSVALVADGEAVAQAHPGAPTDGALLTTLEWTPRETGTTTITVRTVTERGQEDQTFVTLEVVEGQAVPPAAETPDEAPEANAEEATPATDADGALAIQFPATGDAFTLPDDLPIEVRIVARDTGRLISLELYVNAALFRAAEPRALADGTYRLSIPFDPAEPGDYRLEVVAISESSRRYDDRVDIVVKGAQEEEAEPAPAEESETPPTAEPEAAKPDLVITGVESGEANAVVVRVANEGAASLQSTPVLITVVRASDGLVLDEATITLSLSRGGTRTISLPIFLQEPLEIVVAIDSGTDVDESNEFNNTFQTAFAPLSRPDLVAQSLQLSSDGFVIVSIGNIGTANYSGPIVVRVVYNGAVTENLAFNGVLAVQGSLTLSGSTSLRGSGQITAVVDPDNGVAEANEANNQITISVAP